jgi:hypothetical protein
MGLEAENSYWKNPKRVAVDHNSLDRLPLDRLPDNVMAVKATAVGAENVWPLEAYYLECRLPNLEIQKVHDDKVLR